MRTAALLLVVVFAIPGPIAAQPPDETLVVLDG
jgi:hypothetical protein